MKRLKDDMTGMLIMVKVPGFAIYFGSKIRQKLANLAKLNKIIHLIWIR